MLSRVSDVFKVKNPQHKVVFAITSQGNDFYSAMTRVAVASLRVSNPDLRVVIACDRESDEAMRQASDPLIGESDDWMVVETPVGDAGFRNRYVKTSLRSLIDGPFLFLDSDIFVRGDLSEIFSLDCDIAGAPNHSHKAFTEQIWDQDRAVLDLMGWEVGNEVYINGGVLFYNDTEGARRFAVEWHKRWLESSYGRDCYRDQPALNSSLYFIKPKLVVLQDYYNAQIRISPAVAYDAKIWHYYSFVNNNPHTRFELQVKKLLCGASLGKDDVVDLVKSLHPWRRCSAIDDIIAFRIMKRNRFDGWEAAWLRRERWLSFQGSVTRLLARMKQIISS